MKPEGLEIQEPALFNRPLGSPQPSSAGLASIPTTANTSVELIGETLAPNEDKKPQEAIKIGASGNENDALVMTDRGWRAWLAVVAGVINFWAGFGMLNCWGTFQAKYAQEPWGQEVTLADLSWIGSVQPGLLFFLGGVIGFACDKINATVLIIIGTFLFSSAYLLAAEFGNSFGTFLALQGFLYGFSNTLLYYPVTSVISDWFDRRRGLALGIAAAGSSVGGIFWPMVVDKLDESFGMKRALQGVGLIPLIPLLVSAFLVKERSCRKKLGARDIFRLKTKNKNKHMDNDNSSNNQNSNMSNTDRTTSTDGQVCGHRSKTQDLKTVMQPKFVALSIALFFIFGGFLIPFNFIPLFAEYNGQDGMAHILMSICYSGSVVGRIGTGALADHFGTFNVLCAMAFLTSILTLSWIVMTSLNAMIAFAVLYGLFSGGLVPLGSACVAKITPDDDMDHIGSRLGFMMMICSISSFGGGPLSGFLLDSQGQSHGGWLAAFLFSGMLTMVGGCMVLAIIVARLAWSSEKKLAF